MGKWAEKEFGTLYEIPSRNGLSKPSRIRGTGFKMINMGELFSNDRIYDIDMELVPLTDIEKDKARVDIGDLLFARQSLVASGAGKCSIVMETSELTVFESHIIRVRLDKKLADPMFYYYYFKSPTSPMQMIIQHCVQAGIKASDLEKLNVSVPTIEEQRKIGNLLATIDERIEINQKINDNLEQQAQALFKSWFLDYEPWDGIVPDSWVDGKLGDFADIKRGSSPRPIQEYLSDTGLRWLKISDVTSLQTPFVIDIKDHIIEEGLKKTVFLKAGSLVLSNSATPGVPKILDVDSCIHDGWLYFPESKFSKEYLYLYFKYIRQQLVNLSNGSVFNNLKTDILKGYPTILPDVETLRRFDDVVKPMFLQMQNLTRESHNLADTRDAILPKLMSGELDVSDIDL